MDSDTVRNDGGMKVKSATLTPGYWIYVCPCGFQCSVCRVNKTEGKWLVYCFKCKQSNGKYHKVMIERIEFSKNWNGKLNGDSFTMMKLHDPVKYCVGAVKQIYLKGIWKGDARIIDVKRIRLSDINLFVSKLDMGLSAEDCRQAFRAMYKNRPVNWETQLIDLCLLEYLKESKEPGLFPCQEGEVRV